MMLVARESFEIVVLVFSAGVYDFDFFGGYVLVMTEKGITEEEVTAF